MIEERILFILPRGMATRIRSCEALTGVAAILLGMTLAAAGAVQGGEVVAGIDEVPRLLATVRDREARRHLAARLRSGDIDLEHLRRIVASDLAPVPPDAVSTKRLGVTLDRSRPGTVFRLFAPRATAVTLHLYARPAGGRPEDHAMRRDREGVFEASVPGLRVGAYYSYSVAGPSGPGEFFDPDREISDPYAHANVGAPGRSIVIDPSHAWRSTSWKAPPAQDLVIYETHVRGFTAHPSSGVPVGLRGRFLGLLEGRGTGRVLGHLAELGVNAVELMPLHEFDHTAAPQGHVNFWGYMTTHFFAPESSYASGIENAEAVRELKATIDGLHGAGLSVILDVVYNHTAEGNEEGPLYNLKGIDTPYYYRLTPDRTAFLNGTGCGNEFRSESPMARRLILDSLQHWLTEYRVDGFRFDLAPALDRETIMAINDRFPGVVLIAEPWSADWNRRQWDPEFLRGSRWSSWGAQFRETGWAFLRGEAKRDDLMTAMAGSCLWFTARPQQAVNYLECHDGATLADRTGQDARQLRLAAMLVLTGQGIPMLHHGQELGKDKGGNDNSYDQDNATNWIDWTLKERNRVLFDYYRGLIAIRKAHRALRYDRCLTERDVRWIRPSGDRALGILLRGPVGEEDVLVLLNSDRVEPVTFELPTRAAWTVLANDTQAHPDGRLGTATPDYRVPPVTGAILRGKASWD